MIHKYTEQSERPVPCVDVIIFNEKDEVLLLRRDVEPERGGWGLVAGRIEPNDDSIQHAILREVREETGFDIDITHLVDIFADPKAKKSSDTRFYTVQILYLAKYKGGEFLKNEEAKEYKWVSIEDAYMMELIFNHSELLELYKKRKEENKLINISQNKYTEFYGKDFVYRNNSIVRFTTNAIVLNENNEILLAQRSQEPFVGYWDFPGGHMYTDETVEECLKREVKEELGVECDMGELFHVYSDKGHSPKAFDVISFYFTVLHAGEFIPNVEMKDFKYFPLDKLPKNIAYHNEGVLEDIRKYINNKQ